jgi:HlyD family secretion protein
MDRSIFREESQKYFSTPDKLDESLRIVSRIGWLAVIGGLVGSCVLIFWGFFGSINVSVTGLGLLTPPDGIPAVESIVNGVVKEIYVQLEQHVKQGDHIATIDQPVWNVRKQQYADDLEDLVENHKTQTAIETGNKQAVITSYQQQKEKLLESITLTEQQEDIMKKQLKNTETLYQSGIVSEDEYDKSKTDLMSVQQNLKSIKNQIDEINKQISNTETQHLLQIQQRELNIKSKKTELAALISQIKKEGELYAERSGIVSEIPVQVGQTVNTNQAVVLLENVGDADSRQGVRLTAVIFVSDIKAKKIKPGQDVLVSPTTTRPSEHGQITGKVESVSQFPITQNRIKTLFNNDTLVQQFVNQGGVFEVRVVLDTNPATPSGFHWTGGKGPNIAVSSGTFCNATFSVEQKKPASYLIPFLRRKLLGTDDTGMY